jgi:hypothetical protein
MTSGGSESEYILLKGLLLDKMLHEHIMWWSIA